jgi:hypothetical protein
MAAEEKLEEPNLLDSNGMPWQWVLEYLLDVKQLSPVFLKGKFHTTLSFSDPTLLMGS